MIQNKARKAIGFALTCYCVIIITVLAKTHDNSQWDFQGYYYAAQAYAEGSNPYEHFFMVEIEGAQGPRYLRVINPPSMLLLVGILSPLDYNTAFYIFFAVECMSLIALMYLWGWKFLDGERDVLFFVFCLTAFGSPLYIALRAGNCVIIEQCILWIALFFLLKRRLLLFVLFTLVSAMFKGPPLLFLCLLFILGGEKKWRYFAGSLIILIVMVLMFHLFAPVLTTSFLRTTVSLLGKKVSVSQPSSSALLRDLFFLLKKETGVTVPQGIQLSAIMALIAAILLISGRAFNKLISQQLIVGEKVIIYLACIVYVLILPHFEDYSYIVLLLPAYAILKRMSSRNTYTFIFLFIILSSVGTTMPIFRHLVKLVLIYSPLMMAYLLWGVCLRDIAALSQPRRNYR